MSALHPGPPINLGDIEREVLAVLPRHGLVEGRGAEGREGRRHVRVRTVDAAVIQAHPGALFGARDPLPGVLGHVALRHPRREPASHLEDGELRPELPLDPPAAGEGPLGNPYGAPPRIPQGVLYKVATHYIVEVAVADGVAFPRRDLEDLGPLGTADAGGQDGVHDVVYRNDVHIALGIARKLAQDALGEGHDYGVGHPGALDPTRIRLPVAALDDGGPEYDERRLAPLFHGHPLGERLGEGVDVVPAEFLRPPCPALDEPLAHPGPPELVHPSHDLVLLADHPELLPRLRLEAPQQRAFLRS